MDSRRRRAGCAGRFPWIDKDAAGTAGPTGAGASGSVAQRLEQGTHNHLPPPQIHLEKQAHPKTGGFACAPACAEAAADPDLQAIIDAWPALAADVRRTVVGVVRLSLGGGAPKAKARG